MRLLATLLCLALPTAHAQTHPLNDTGITWSGEAVSGNATACDPAQPAGQDCHYGRDASARSGTLPAKVGGSTPNNGVANGFDFTKISGSGNTLPASAALGSGAGDWSCTRDNVTGLIWEIKVDDAAHPRHMGHTYTWYNTDPATSGGTDGALGNTTTCGDTLSGQQCNTQHYVAAVNTTGLCGHADWRMPTVKELESLADLGRVNPTIDPDYFPNTPPSNFWTSSPYASNILGLKWVVVFDYGISGINDYSNSYSVRLVRGGQ